MNPGDFYFLGLMQALPTVAHLATGIDGWHPPHGPLMLHVGNGQAPKMILTMERVRAVHRKAEIAEGLALGSAGPAGILTFVRGAAEQDVYLVEAIFLDENKQDLLAGNCPFV